MVSRKIRNVFYRNFPADSRIHALPDPSRVTLVSSETYSNNANNANNANNPNIPIFSMCSEIVQGSSPKTKIVREYSQFLNGSNENFLFSFQINKYLKYLS